MKNKSYLLSVTLFLLICVSFAFAEGTAKGGEEFRKTASEYQQQADKYQEMGKADEASKYRRLAEIKNNAADLADRGEWESIDWTEYHKINEELAGLKEGSKKVK